MQNLDAIIAARRLYYALFAELFVFSYDEHRFSSAGKILQILATSALDEPSSEAIERLLPKFNPENLAKIAHEYDDIFHSPPRPLHNTFSYYDEGYEMGYACVRVREVLAQTDLRRDEAKFKENEDAVGFVFSLMSEFLSGPQTKIQYADELFKEIIHPHIDKFIAQLFTHPSAQIYRDICVILQSFVEFERLFYELPKPAQEQDRSVKSYEGISRSEMIRREKNRVRKQTQRSVE